MATLGSWHILIFTFSDIQSVHVLFSKEESQLKLYSFSLTIMDKASHPYSAQAKDLKPKQ